MHFSPRREVELKHRDRLAVLPLLCVALAGALLLGQPAAAQTNAPAGQGWSYVGPLAPVRLLDATLDGRLLAQQSPNRTFASDDSGGHWRNAPAPLEDESRLERRADGVYRTTDAGVTWHRVLPDEAFALARSPADPAWWYAEVNLTETRGTRLYIHGTRMLRSRDDGETWTEMSRRDPDWPAAAGSSCRWETRLDLDPLDVSRLFRVSACYTGKGGEGRLELSVDQGATWVVVSSPDRRAPGQAFGYPASLILSRSNANRAYLATDSSHGPGSSTPGLYNWLFRSDDRGATWTELSLWDRDPSFVSQSFTLREDPTNADRLYAAIGLSGVHLSADGGQSWTDVGLHGAPVEDLRVAASRLLFASTPLGLYRLDLGGDPTAVAPVPAWTGSRSLTIVSDAGVGLLDPATGQSFAALFWPTPGVLSAPGTLLDGPFAQLYVARPRSERNATESTLWAFDVHTGEVRLQQPLAGGSGPLATTPDGSRVYLGLNGPPPDGGGSVLVVDAGSSAVVDTLALPGALTDLAVSAEGDRLFVDLPDLGSVAVFDTASDAPLDSLAVTTPRLWPVTTPHGPRLFGVDPPTNTLVAIDPATGDVEPVASAVGPACPPAFTRDGQRLYRGQDREHVGVFDTVTLEQLASFGALADPCQLWLDPAGTHLFVVQRPDPDHTSIAVLDPTTGQRLRTLALGDGSVASVWPSPDGASLYVPHSGLLDVVDLATGQVQASWPVSGVHLEVRAPAPGG